MNKNTRTAQLTFFLMDLDGGGAERAIISLAGEIAKRDVNVDLVVGDASSRYRSEVSPDVNLIDFDTRSKWRVFIKLLDYLKTGRPSAIMSALDWANVFLVLASKIACYRGRVIVSQRAVIDATLNELRPSRRFIMNSLLKFCFSRADKVVSNSFAASSEVVERWNVLPSKLATIQNSIDLKRIQSLANEPIEDLKGVDPSVPLVVAVGSLSERKDFITLIRAFALVLAQKDVELLILGEGPQRSMLETIARKFEVAHKVHLPGFDQNPYKWIKISSVFVSSSTGEGFPNVLAEALSLGRQIVATDCPGDTCRLLENGKWGRLVPVGDHSAMATEIIAALDFPLSNVGTARAADFSPSRNADQYIRVLMPTERMNSVSTQEHS
ncbi:glycosyltransferase [Thalassospira indica]|uniref:Glycosyltransferase n=1 Tax=Thalassospira indica TaxID=1891279 RepID=A0ABM6XWB5_9PROT|nr:glycosyltransferase [Thalassospira indica]AXO13643.1 glycosyltransferase [Thalassospira indica]OAZ14475.1 hypothetical protein TH15_01270 [Thalassospira profundimaris]